MLTSADRRTIRDLWNGYADSNIAVRALASARTMICPFERVARHIPFGSNVLDIGCGTGAFVTSLAIQGRISSAVGCDVSSIALEAGQRAIKRLNLPNLEFYHASTMSEWPSKKFDVVCLIDILHHIRPVGQKQFFMEAASKVTPGGLMIYKDMADRPAWKAWTNRIHDLVLARDWINYVPFRLALQWSDNISYKTIATDQFTVGPYAHELAVFQRPIT
jgi:2-polyprenyl-3-methyl-5-hydroxy-6-metoxy-1,4-benzoquinol methylase